MRKRSRSGVPTPRSLVLLGAILSAALGLVAPSTAGPAEPQVVYPQVAGTTIIRWEGIKGVKLHLPEAARLSARDLSLAPADASTLYMWSGFRPDAEARAWCDFCLINVAERFDPHPLVPSVTTCTNAEGSDVGCPYEPGILELYLVSNGPAELTIKFRNLSGSKLIPATAAVDGHVKQLPITGCAPLPDCSRGFGYGGETRDIGLNGRPAMAWVRSFYNSPASTNPGLRGMRTCAYPGASAPSASGALADHPRGCDEDAAPELATGGEASSIRDVSWRVHGKQYLGFSVWNRRTLQDATFRVWAFWLEAGMTCPSGDFNDCGRPAPQA